MWWDLLRNFDDERDAKVKDAMLAALSRILQLDSPHCHLSALHGLGHLEHDGKREIIERFLETNPRLDEEMKAYAAAAIESRVL
jgi:hypothetical protein